MPRRYKKRYRKRRSNAPSVGGCASLGLSYAKKALSYSKYLRTLLNVEYKYFDTSKPIAEVLNTGVITPLTHIPQGDTVSTRDGDSVRAKMLSIKGNMLGSSGGLALQPITIIVFQWFDSSAPAVGDILGPGAPNPISPLNRTRTDKFKVLMRKQWVLSNMPANPDNIKQYSQAIKLNTHVKWNATGAANVESGHFYVLEISDATTTVCPQTRFIARVSYIDN